jgi:general secretion pathway protein G
MGQAAMKKTNRRRMRAGFSLLELMLVLAIIGVLTAVAAVSLSGAGGRAKKNATKASMNTIRNAVRNFQLDNNAYPPNLAALTVGKTAYLSNDFKLADGWGQEFLYAAPGSGGREFDLYSKGDDGVFGTADDIDVWKLDTSAPQ